MKLRVILRRRQVTTTVALVVLSMYALVACAQEPAGDEHTTWLGQQIETLSGAGGYFDTDNLISNELSYSQVVDQLKPVGGVYIGVGPEQNFTYIGRTRPSWAFVIDIRRDNMVHHLLLNAILSEATTPLDYLNLLFSRPTSEKGGVAQAGELSAARLVELLESTTPRRDLYQANLERFEDRIRTRIGFSLTERDRESLHSIYEAFFRDQLEIRFRSHGRAVSRRYPSYRDLLLAQTPLGEDANFLGRFEDYKFLRELVLEDRLIPVVGNFAGDKALPAVAQFIAEQDEVVSTFYTSNVEYYLFDGSSFSRWAENVRRLPVSSESVFLRAYFNYGMPHPLTRQNPSAQRFRSTLVRQPIKAFLSFYDADELDSYWEVCTRGYLSH